MNIKYLSKFERILRVATFSASLLVISVGCTDAQVKVKNLLSKSTSSSSGNFTFSSTSLSGSYILNAPAFDMSGTCTAPSTLNITASDGTNTSSVSPTCSSGTWSTVMNVNTLAEGNLTFTYTETSSSGSITKSTVLIKDTVHPTIVSMTSSVASYTNVPFLVTIVVSEPTDFNPAMDLNVTNATLTYTMTGSTQYNVTVTPITTGSVNIAALISGAFNDFANLGNTAGGVAISTTFDNISPTVSFAPAPAAYSNATSGTILFTSSDAESSVVSAYCRLDGASFTPCTTLSTAGYGGLSDGLHVMDIKVIDSAGNSSSVITANWTIDTIAPVLNYTSMPSSNSNSTNASFSLSTSETIMLYQCSTNGSTYSACPSPAPPFLLSGLTDGAHSYYVKGQDQAGNWSTPISYFWSTDTIAPTVNISGPFVLSGYSQANATATVKYTIQFTGATSYNLTPGDISITPAGSNCSVSFPSGVSANTDVYLTGCTGTSNSYQISLSSGKAQDSALNQAPSANSSTFLLDSTMPIFGGFINPLVASVGPNAQYTFSWNSAIDAGGNLGTSPYWVQQYEGSNCIGTAVGGIVGPVTPTSYFWDFFANQKGIPHSILVSVIDQAGNTTTACSSDIYTYEQMAYFKANNVGDSDEFGTVVALDGDTLVVGAPLEDSYIPGIQNTSGTISQNEGALDSGAVYVYRQVGNNWVQEAYIKAPYIDPGDHFGASIAISGDTLVVGAPLESSNQTTISNGDGVGSPNNSFPSSGAVYVYKRTGPTWAQEAYIKAANAGLNDNFGQSVSISFDTIVVGATGEDSNQTIITNGTTASSDNSLANSGAAYVYKRTGTAWAQEAYIKAANAGSSDNFGQSVSISFDTIVIGAAGEDSNQTTITNGVTASSDNSLANSGAAYVYKRTGPTWAQEAYIKAANAGGSDNFGQSVSISFDTIVIGATGEDSNQTTITNGSTASSNNSFANSGAAYVYKRTGPTWAQEAYIKPSNNQSGYLFGSVVHINAETIAVGAPLDDSNQSSISNGPTASSNTFNADSGAAFIFKRNGTLWTQDAYLKPSFGDAGYNFGGSVSISNNFIAVGSPFENSWVNYIINGTSTPTDSFSIWSGAAFIFNR